MASVAVATDRVFALLALRVAYAHDAAPTIAMKPEKQLFKFSILYLFLMFGALVVDRWCWHDARRTDLIRRRQTPRARVMAVLLGAFVVLSSRSRS